MVFYGELDYNNRFNEKGLEPKLKESNLESELEKILRLKGLDIPKITASVGYGSTISEALNKMYEEKTKHHKNDANYSNKHITHKAQNDTLDLSLKEGKKLFDEIKKFHELYLQKIEIYNDLLFSAKSPEEQSKIKKLIELENKDYENKLNSFYSRIYSRPESNILSREGTELNMYLDMLDAKKNNQYIYYFVIDVNGMKELNNHFGYDNTTNILRIVMDKYSELIRNKNRNLDYISVIGRPHDSGDEILIAIRTDKKLKEHELKEIADRFKSVDVNKHIYNYIDKIKYNSNKINENHFKNLIQRILKYN